MANSAAPDQLASEKSTYLDLHYLQRQGISQFSRTKVKFLEGLLEAPGSPSILQTLIGGVGDEGILKLTPVSVFSGWLSS